jgi:cytochrome c oxidase assembly protein subunit 15
MYEPSGPRERAVPVPFLALAHLTTLALAVTVVVGVLTTGAGPHSGDENVIRDGFDASLLAHIHSWPGYILLGLVVVLTVWAAVARLRPLGWLIVLLIGLIVQIAVGVYQARMGLPVLAVGVHMVLASLTSAAMTAVILRLKRPVAAPVD